MSICLESFKFTSSFTIFHILSLSLCSQSLIYWSIFVLLFLSFLYVLYVLQNVQHFVSSYVLQIELHILFLVLIKQRKLGNNRGLVFKSFFFSGS